MDVSRVDRVAGSGKPVHGEPIPENCLHLFDALFEAHGPLCSGNHDVKGEIEFALPKERRNGPAIVFAPGRT